MHSKPFIAILKYFSMYLGIDTPFANATVVQLFQCYTIVRTLFAIVPWLCNGELSCEEYFCDYFDYITHPKQHYRAIKDLQCVVFPVCILMVTRFLKLRKNLMSKISRTLCAYDTIDNRKLITLLSKSIRVSHYVGAVDAVLFYLFAYYMRSRVTLEFMTTRMLICLVKNTFDATFAFSLSATFCVFIFITYKVLIARVCTASSQLRSFKLLHCVQLHNQLTSTISSINALLRYYLGLWLAVCVPFLCIVYALLFYRASITVTIAIVVVAAFFTLSFNTVLYFISDITTAYKMLYRQFYRQYLLHLRNDSRRNVWPAKAKRRLLMALEISKVFRCYSRRSCEGFTMFSIVTVTKFTFAKVVLTVLRYAVMVYKRQWT